MQCWLTETRMFSLNATQVSCFYCGDFVAENLSSAVGAFQMYKVPIPPNIVSKQGSEGGSNNMDFIFESIQFLIKAAGQKNYFETGKKNRGSFKTN